MTKLLTAYWRNGRSHAVSNIVLLSILTGLIILSALTKDWGFLVYVVSAFLLLCFGVFVDIQIMSNQGLGK